MTSKKEIKNFNINYINDCLDIIAKNNKRIEGPELDGAGLPINVWWVNVSGEIQGHTGVDGHWVIDPCSGEKLIAW